MYQKVKSVADIIVGMILFVILTPIFLFTSILLLLTLKGNPFFSQLRPGKMSRIFRLYKFRTMTNEVDKNGTLLPDDERLTKVGRFVRKASLDEIPQLVNVIKGEMSIIGPRPLLPEYLPLYSAHQKRRHEVNPGITGWAQVNGRNAISWEKKFELDVWYVDHVSFALDLKIIWMTILKVIRRDSVSSSTSVTMEKFKGSNL